MPIPSQNEILVPFLETLRDGQPHSRSQILGSLAKRFQLSETELNATSGQQFTILNRIAWCDTYFVKAAFVQKERHSKDPMQDRFRITIVGQNNLQRHASRIDVAYLQSFYRGKVYRGAGSSDTTSDAELDFFERLNDLPSPFQAFHSISWIGQGQRTVGEIDFLIAHPDYGILVMEVKGGEITIQREANRSVWYSRDYYGNLNNIGDPCAQAERNRRELGDYLRRQNRNTRGHNFALFPALAFPESQVDSNIRMDCPADIIIDHRHLDTLPERLTSIFKYWQAHADNDNKVMGGQAAIVSLIDALIPSLQLRPRIGDVFERERRKIDELTQQQFRVLGSLRRHRRAAIVGGAGTGKTMLAMEKAQQLADDNLRVLFLAFNRNIVDWIENNLSNERITVSTYHSFVAKTQQLAGQNRSRNMDWDEFISKAPDLLLEAAEIIRRNKPEECFDAIIVDEAQDFEDSMWIPLPDLLKDPDNGIFYVFFDDNQRLYTQISNIPMERDPYYLTDNCRNTQRIHASMMPYAISNEDSYCDGPDGRDIEIIPVTDNKTAQKELQALLHRLVREENVRPEDIIILSPNSERTSLWKSDTILGNFALTWDMQSDMNMAIRVCTIYSFKGLESAVIILTELDKLRSEIASQLLYVGLSRARHHAIVLGELPRAGLSSQ
jgi:hypothetical protein